MGWRDRLLKASYNGVGFYVDNVNVEAPRRVSLIKLAGADGAVAQDLGADSQRYQVDAFLVGEDYDRARDQLVKELRVAGSGRLVLPTQGPQSVRIVSGPNVSETRGKQGYCVVRFAAVKDEGVLLVTRSSDRSAALATKALALKTAARTDFDSSYKPSTITKYLSAPANALGAVSSQLGKAQRMVAMVTNPISDFTAQLNNITNQATSLAQAPAQLSASVAGVVEGVISLAVRPASTAITSLSGAKANVLTPFERARPTSVLNAALRSTLSGLGDGEPDPNDTLIELEAEQRANVRAIYRLTRATAIAAHVEAVMASPFDSSTLALATMQQISDEISALQQLSPTDALFDQLSDFRSALVDYIVQTAAQLPKAVKVTQRLPVPALVLAYQQYGDARRETEVIGRNNVARPLEVQGEVEVLTR